MTRWTRSTRLALLVIGSLATSVAAQPAAAPKKQPTQQELAGARAHFKAAEAAKARGDYKAAATEYLAAHELFPDPEFFFNVGEVYRLAGDEPDALTYYQKYLDLEPGGRGAAAARTAVDQLRRSIAAQQAAAKRAADDEARRKAADDARRKADQDAARRAAADEARRKAAEDARRKADEAAAKRAAEDEARRKAADNAQWKADEEAARRADDEARHKQPATSPEAPPAAFVPATWAWYRDPIALALLGTGVAAVGVGTGFWLSAQSADHDAKTATTYQQVRNAGDRASQRGTRAAIAGGVGIALVGGGVAWIVLHRDASEQRTVTGWLVPGGGGLAVHGRF
jgi:tetratricopeptide (TPR) repeat protein